MGSGVTRREAIATAGAVLGASLSGCTGQVKQFAGGATGATGPWQIVDPPAEGVTLHGVEFVDESRGWMAVGANDAGNNGGFYYTEDGGTNWERRKEEDAREVTVADEGGRVYGFGSAGSEIYTWYSDDGQDWEPVTNDAWWLTETIEDAVFFTDEVGIAASSTGRRIQRTTDGGGNFEKQDLEDCSINDVVAVGDTAMLVGNTDAESSNEGGCLLRSDARGEPGSWSLTRFTDEAHDYAGGALTGIYAPSADEVWVVGRNRQMYHTTDGGDSWTQMEGVDGAISSFAAIDGIDDHLIALAFDEGSASGQGGIVYESTDGGESWEITWQAPEGDNTAFGGLEFVAPDLAYAYSEFGDLMEFTGR